MFVYIFIKKLLGNWIDDLKRLRHVALTAAANPSCRFSGKCTLSESKFEKYVVVFGTTTVYDANIGAYSYIQTNGRIYKCDVGRFCSIAADVTIAPGMHDIIHVTTHPSFSWPEVPLPRVFTDQAKGNLFKRVSIGHDVWIGGRVIILDGVKIGNGAVIAAGAVVVKDVEPYSVVGGVPAHHIKYRFSEQTIRDLEQSRWWDRSEEWLVKHAEEMADVNQFIESISRNENSEDEVIRCNSVGGGNFMR